MPIHLDVVDVASQVQGLNSVLIAACNMCAGASLAMRDSEPFLQFFGSLLKSPPLERHIRTLESQLGKMGVKAKKFKGGVIQQFFLCLWTSRQRRKFQECAKQYDGVIVLGCDSATVTVEVAVKGMACRVVEGMKVAGIMNTRTRFHLPCDISFDQSEVVPMCDLHCKQAGQESQ